MLVAGWGGGVITIHHKGCFLISHTLISFCLQIAFLSSLACVCVALQAGINTNQKRKKKKKLTGPTDLLPALSALLSALLSSLAARGEVSSQSRVCSGTVRAREQVPANRSSPGGRLDYQLSDLWAV